LQDVAKRLVAGTWFELCAIPYPNLQDVAKRLVACTWFELCAIPYLNLQDVAKRLVAGILPLRPQLKPRPFYLGFSWRT
jgi:hypothetical protein